MISKNCKQAEALVRVLGGTSVVGRLFSVKKQSVNSWLSQGMPKARLQTLHAWARLPDGEVLPEPEVSPARVRAALAKAKLAEPGVQRRAA